MYKLFFGLLAAFLVGCFGDGAENISHEAHAQTMVAVHFTVKQEEERVEQRVFATVINNSGLLAAYGLFGPAIPSSWVHDVKVYVLGENSDGYHAEYLGIDDNTEFHYFQVEPSAWQKIRSAFDYSIAQPQALDDLWGISSLEYSSDFYKPLFLHAKLAGLDSRQFEVGLCTQPVSSLGGPVFDKNGKFAGIIFDALIMGYDMQLEGKVYAAALRRRRVGDILLMAKDLQTVLLKDPRAELQQPSPWLGVSGLQPLPNDSLAHLGYPNNSGFVVSQVIQASAAEKAGVLSGDIVLGVDGNMFDFFPDEQSVVSNFQFYVQRHKKPGDLLSLQVLRNQKIETLSVTLDQAPKKDRDMPRLYFKRIGATVKAFSFLDGIKNQLYSLDQKGAVVQYVKPTGPSGDAGLLPGDWIQEIDGVVIQNYDDAIDLLTKIEEDPIVSSFVVLVERNNETKLLKIKLD